MSNRLLVNPGTPQAWEISLKPGVNRIGRSADNDFVINHPSISTHHCEITLGEGTVLLKDLNSTNGTFVARVPVTEFQLQSGHHVQFGAVDMLFESTSLPILPDAVNLPGDGARVMVANPGPGTPPTPPAPPIPGGLRINRHAPAAGDPAAPNPAALPANFKPLTGATPLSPQSHAGFTAEQNSPDQKAFARGVGGAVAGALLGLIGWYFLTILTGYQIGYAAWGVGLLTGGLARLLAKQTSPMLGVVCGIAAALAIVGGQYLAAKHDVNQLIAEGAEESYQEKLTRAQAVTQLKSPDEMRAYLAAEFGLNPGEITAEAVQELEKEMPELRNFVSGKPSKAEFIQQEMPEADSVFYNILLLVHSFSLFLILWVFLGVASAYKLGAGTQG